MEIHAHIAAFQEFFFARSGILEKTGHDADAAHVIADLEKLSLLQHYFLRVYIDGSFGGRFAIKKSGKIRVGYGLEGLAVLGDLDFEPVAVVHGEAMLRFALARTEMPLPDAGDVL